MLGMWMFHGLTFSLRRNGLRIHCSGLPTRRSLERLPPLPDRNRARSNRETEAPLRRRVSDTPTAPPEEAQGHRRPDISGKSARLSIGPRFEGSALPNQGPPQPCLRPAHFPDSALGLAVAWSDLMQRAR